MIDGLDCSDVVWLSPKRDWSRFPGAPMLKEFTKFDEFIVELIAF